MAPGKSPAFQFYAKDFLSGTATMSLAERGAYVSLLAHQWDTGSVPDSAKERARILRCSNAEERKIWARLVSKFSHENESFINHRLEEERQKQAEYRRRQSDKGRASAATRRQPESNHGSTAVDARLQPEWQPEGNSSISYLQSSSSKEQQPRNGAPLIMNPLAYERRKQQCAFVGARLEVPHALHVDMRKLLGGANAETDLLAWYGDLDGEIEASGEPITPDVFKWLKARFARWKAAAPTQKTTAEIMAEIAALPKGIGR